MAEGSATVEVEIPDDRDDAIERYRTEPLFHSAIDWFARQNAYSRDQLLSGDGPVVLEVPKCFMGLA